MTPKSASPRSRPRPDIALQRRTDGGSGARRGMASSAMAARARNLGADMVAIDDLADNPENPRTTYDETRDRELADDMAAQGVLQPLLVVSAEAFRKARPGAEDSIGDARWVIIAGHRRIRAARQAGLKEVPVYVRDDRAGVREAIRVGRSENHHRVNLTPLEEARQLGELRDRENLSQREIAQAMGMSPGQVAKRMKLLKLPAEGAELLTSNRIDLQAAMALADVKDEAVRDAVITELSHRPAGRAPLNGDEMRFKIDAVTKDVTAESAKARLRSQGIPIDPWMAHGVPIENEDELEQARREQTLRATVDREGEINYFRAAPSQATSDALHDVGDLEGSRGRLQEQWGSATAQRRTFIAEIVSRPLSREDKHRATTTALRSVLVYPRRGATELIQKWVGDRWGQPTGAFWSLEIDEDHLLPLSLAYGLACAELDLDTVLATDSYLYLLARTDVTAEGGDPGQVEISTPADPLPLDHYAWLKGHGYEPAPIEDRLLALAASMEAQGSGSDEDHQAAAGE